MELSEIWKLVQQAGPFASALLLYLYLDERKERRKKDEELKAVLSRSITVIDEVKNAFLFVPPRGERTRDYGSASQEGS